MDDAVAGDERQAAVQAAIESIDAGRSVILYSARGPNDERIAETEKRAAELQLDETAIGSRLGREQGAILREVLERTTVDRVCVAGGDTSGYAAPALDVYALELLTPLAPGGPLCRASSEDDRFDGLEIALKGGQVGQADYFGLVRDGGELAGAE
ncbi:nucleotide-binding domain containing protein [Halosimplex aquaticum]